VLIGIAGRGLSDVDGSRTAIGILDPHLHALDPNAPSRNGDPAGSDHPDRLVGPERGARKRAMLRISRVGHVGVSLRKKSRKSSAEIFVIEGSHP
jgi:hypothetical protein